MMKVKTVQLEDNEEYVIVDTILIEDTKYIYLNLPNEIESEEIEMPEIIIRKYDKKEKYILGLDTEEEYNKALKVFVNKWKKLRH